MGEKISKRKEYQGFMRGEDGQPVVIDMESITYRPEVDPEDFVRQAPPIRITPSRARKKHREGIKTRIISVPDSQIGYRDTPNGMVELHDERAIHTARFLIKSLQPDIIVLQGDTIDLPELTRFDPDSNHFTPKTLQMGIDRTAEFKAGFRADNPNADIHELEGNHEVRLGRFVLKHAQRLHGISQAGSTVPVLGYDFLTRNEEMGITYHDGYPANEFAYSDDLIFIHGKEVASGGSTAKKYSDKYPDVNVVFGHIHRHEVHSRTTRLGKLLVSATFGTLAKIDGTVPSYHSGVDGKGLVANRFENWSQGFGIIDDYGGVYTFRHVPIIDGVGYAE